MVLSLIRLGNVFARSQLARGAGSRTRGMPCRADIKSMSTIDRLRLNTGMSFFKVHGIKYYSSSSSSSSSSSLRNANRSSQLPPAKKKSPQTTSSNKVDATRHYGSHGTGQAEQQQQQQQQQQNVKPKQKIIKIETAEQLEQILQNVGREGQIVEISDYLKPSTTGSATLSKMDDQARFAQIHEPQQQQQQQQEESHEIPNSGKILGLLVVSVMVGSQFLKLVNPDVWQQYFTVSIDSAPVGSIVKINPLSTVLNLFAPVTMFDALFNSFVGYFAIRVTAITFGSFMTASFLLFFATFANRVLLYDGEKTRDVKVDKIVDGEVQQQTVKVCRGLSHETSNTVMIFSLASFIGMILPNTMVPLIGACPLLALPLMGVVSDSFTLFKVARQNQTTQENESSSKLLSQSRINDMAHIYGLAAGWAVWFVAIRWTRVGKRLRVNSPAMQHAITATLMTPPKFLHRFLKKP
ncbi:hypothetical protein V1514DRAFT_329612 [Lipomyces japonicus]|uniref:uncharacterized protein n=1 Tax=Lipomyces japonicus TaxID=56871 RepID=UPI0034CE98AF